MPRTPYEDPEAEKAYQDMQKNSSRVSGADDGYETSRQVNVGAKTSKGFDKLKPLPNTDDNTFFSRESEGNIIRAKRLLRDKLNGK